MLFRGGWADITIAAYDDDTSPALDAPGVETAEAFGVALDDAASQLRGVLDLRARVRLRRTLVDQRGEWQQRMQAVLYHHGLPKRAGLLTRENRALVEQLALPAAGREQITVALGMTDAPEVSDRAAR